ncbi:MAG: hypothetical protein JST85_19390 [Acidobacteria bacterium]|nr:hypothetical protein [Acidobacteriota bacterium]
MSTAQSWTAPSSVIDIQSHRLRDRAISNTRSDHKFPESEAIGNEAVLQREGTYGLPIGRVDSSNLTLEKKQKRLVGLPTRKTRSTTSRSGLKGRSLKKAEKLDMPPTPVGHDWHLTDGGWNLVKTWSEKDGLLGTKVKKERYAGFLSREAWQVMKEYEYEKIIAQIGQSGRHSRS